MIVKFIHPFTQQTHAGFLQYSRLLQYFYNIPGHIQDTKVTETDIGPWPLKVYILVGFLKQHFEKLSMLTFSV